MTETTELQRELDTDAEEQTNDSTTDTENEEIPSWSELLSRSDKPSVKKSSIGYLAISASIFAGTMFFAPVTVGFSVSILIVTLISGLIGKQDALGAGVAGVIGGAASSLFTSGIAAITLTPIVAGAVTGLLAAVLGALAGRWINNKIR